MAGSEHPFDVVAQPEARPAASAELQRVADLLGGDKTFGGSLTEPLDAHEKLLQGLPGQALGHLLDNLIVLKKGESLEAAVGMSLRTFQRRKDAPKPLSKDQSGRAWKFAEILARATTVFGSQQAAEQWMERPAIGLNDRRPIDLLATQAGVDVVEQFLARLEYGVYA
jgi:putative toxin-antitoxin system antitoxin component (TIGR02293 family)